MLNVVMTTYFTDEVPERASYALQTLDSLQRHLVFSDPEEQIRLCIADDSERPMTLPIKTLVDRLRSNVWAGQTAYTCAGHRGIGASLNLALTGVDKTENWMYITDDWELQAPLLLDGPLALLRMGYDVVRLGPVHPDLCCVTRFDSSIGWWLDLHQQYGGFAFATRPFVATKAFIDKIGPFDELQNSYETERLYAERVAKSTSKLAYWGGIGLHGPWTHLGIREVGYKEVV